MKTKIWISTISTFALYILFYSFAFWQSVTDITASFCNSWNITSGLNFSTNSAKLNEICTQFTNNTEKDIAIKIWFPDWTITNDNFKNRACKWEWKTQDFWQYIIQKNKWLVIPSKQTIKEKTYIRFPAWFAGIVHGCMTYFLDATTTTTNLVNVVVRQTSFIDILVWSNFKREIILKDFDKLNNWWWNKKLNTEFNFDSTISLKLNFINNWDVDELFIWSWKIYDNLWFSKTFEISQIRLSANSTKDFSINIWSLPFYGWFFKIEVNWNITPEILFNKDSLDPKLKEIIIVQEETTIKVIPWNIIIWIIIFVTIFFLIRHFKKRKK